MSVSATERGLSPQVRGNRLGMLSQGFAQGPIPAGAGEPVQGDFGPLIGGAYPRRCGGTGRNRKQTAAEPGLSPQVRGNHANARPVLLCRGPIPAGAGEPGGVNRDGRQRRAYPRRCGGTALGMTKRKSAEGLSPQVRGNRVDHHLHVAELGPIPAGAGEPASVPAHGIGAGAYPRRCGGTRPTDARASTAPGLSPQVRGNPARAADHPHRSGPIPAGAGEPAVAVADGDTLRAYPRRCGGTNLHRLAIGRREGLSPQVRGNRLVDGLPGAAVGAYPRRCGGTDRV